MAKAAAHYKSMEEFLANCGSHVKQRLGPIAEQNVEDPNEVLNELINTYDSKEWWKTLDRLKNSIERS